MPKQGRARRSILPKGERHKLRLRHAGSATVVATQEPSGFLRQFSVVANAYGPLRRPLAEGENFANCLGAAQLELAPDKTPYPNPALKRLVLRETDGVTPLADSHT